MNILKPITITVGILFFGGINPSAQAQKTTNVQEAPVWAPDNIKIDGKLNEWNDNFQALNKATQVYYTLANDAKNLYLAIKSVNQNTANKIVAGGINLTINATGKKSDRDAVVITFPTSNLASLRNQVTPAVRQAGDVGRQQVDTELVAAVHKAAIDAAKEIKIRGVKDITDSVLSVYNEYGVKAAISYDTRGNLTYELAIPLRYLQIQEGVPFAYNLKVNGIGGNNNTPLGGLGGMVAPPPVAVPNQFDRNTANVIPGSGSGGGFTSGPGSSRPADMIVLQDMMYPTDFWGKYTPAKK